MEKYKINISKKFEEELLNIFYHIFFFLKSPIVAFNTYNLIIKSAFSLSYFPERHSKFENSNLCKLTVANYVIVYDVDKTSLQVFLLHIFNRKAKLF